NNNISRISKMSIRDRWTNFKSILDSWLVFRKADVMTDIFPHLNSTVHSNSVLKEQYQNQTLTSQLSILNEQHSNISNLAQWEHHISGLDSLLKLLASRLNDEPLKSL